MRRLSADMHRGQRASLRNQTDYAIKAGYKGAADFFATQHKFLLLPGRHPYKHHESRGGSSCFIMPNMGNAVHLNTHGARTIWAVTAKEQDYQRGFKSVRPLAA